MECIYIALFCSWSTQRALKMNASHLHIHIPMQGLLSTVAAWGHPSGWEFSLHIHTPMAGANLRIRSSWEFSVSLQGTLTPGEEENLLLLNDSSTSWTTLAPIMIQRSYFTLDAQGLVWGTRTMHYVCLHHHKNTTWMSVKVWVYAHWVRRNVCTGLSVCTLGEIPILSSGGLFVVPYKSNESHGKTNISLFRI